MNKRFLLIITFTISIALAFLSPPSIFSNIDFMSRDIRAFLGLFVMLLLILCSGRATITIFDMCAFSCVMILFSVEFFWQRSQWNNILSYYAVVIFYLLLFMTLRDDKLNRDIFIRTWIRTGYFMSIFSIIVFGLHQFTSLNTDFFNFSTFRIIFQKL